MHRKSVPLPPAFIAFAKSFSIVPAELAERVLTNIGNQKTKAFTITRKLPQKKAA